MEPIGYPSFFLYIILLIGIPLAFARPFKAFLMVTFLVAAADANAFTYTRTPLLGPYFNANDACLLVALSALLPFRIFQIKRIQFPKVVILIITVLLIGFIQSLLVMGWTYEGLRALRWAINLPIYFFIAATMVDNKYKVKLLLLALFLGSLVSGVEHILFVRSSLHSEIGQFRTIAFRSPGIWFLLAGLVWLPKFKGMNRTIMFGAGILFAVSVLLNQTRSIWISSIAVLPITFQLFQQKKIIAKAIVLPVVLSVLYAGVLLTTHYTTPTIKPGYIITQRLGTLTNEDERYTSTATRRESFKREIEEWRQGTLIFGRGLHYYALYPDVSTTIYRIAWGHLGHVTTLAQLGLIGLLVYSFYLPISVVQLSRRLWQETSDEVKFLGLLAGMTMIWSWICFLMSDSFLGQHAIGGIIFGAAWRQAMLLRKDKALKRKIRIHEISQRLFPRRIVCK